LHNTDVLDVWLVYRRDAVDAPMGEDGCEHEERAGRFRETPEIRFTAAGGGPAAGQSPPGVPAADIPFPPSRMPPDDPANEWPVFLGQIHRSPGQGGAFVYRADGTGRPYAGARAARIEPPWAAPDGARVELDPPPGTNALELSSVDANGTRRTVMSVSDDGDLALAGTAEVGGELRVGGSRVTLDPAAAPGGSAWRIYLVDGPGQAPDELRIEIGDDPGRVVVGTWSATQNAFVPRLTIEASGQVIVSGDLRVTGQLTATPSTTVLRAYLDNLTGDAAARASQLKADVKALDAALWAKVVP
jgi:hypothetical protein